MAFVLCGWGSCWGARTWPSEVRVLRQGHTQQRPPVGQSHSRDSGLARGPPGPATASGPRQMVSNCSRVSRTGLSHYHPWRPLSQQHSEDKLWAEFQRREGLLFNQLLTPQVLSAQVQAGGAEGGTPPGMTRPHQHQAASLFSLLRPGRGPGSLSHCSPAPLGPSS